MKHLISFALYLTLLNSCSFPTVDIPISGERELKDNYDKKHTEIAELKRYFNSITPGDLDVYIEFKNGESMTLKVFYVTVPKYPRKVLFQQWDVNPYNYKPGFSASDSTEWAAQINSLSIVKKRLNWTDNTFKTIKKYLDKANCISVSNGEPASIGFRRSGMGMYFYDLFDKSLSDSLKLIYNDSCTYRLYNDTLALEYGGGAAGSQCFPTQ